MNIEASIVVPTYRRPDQLRILLEALAEQLTHINKSNLVEIIVVDNCPDASAFSVVDESLAIYVNEARTGIANARNRGVNEAKGNFIIFIDDDEVPMKGWLQAFLDNAVHPKAAYFGPIEPGYAITPPVVLIPVLEQLFSRRLRVVDGKDISGMRAYLGAGNSMLSRQLCLAEPFDERFNTGGEDVWFLRRIVEEYGVRLHWCAGAKIREIVPAERMTQTFIRQRRFRSGQLRCIVESEPLSFHSIFSVGFWMGVGFLQVCIYGGIAILLNLLRRHEAQRFYIHCAGGMGKLMWWAKPLSSPIIGGN